MRLFFSSLIAAGVLISQSAQAECARPAEQAAFDVEQLKSELMVTAISCKVQDRYNAFVNRYKSDIVSNEKTINGFFARNNGRQAQKQHDEYITQLANAQSQEGLTNGTAFCDERLGMFDEVMALPSSQDLPDYEHGKNVATPVDFTTCAAEPEKAGRSGRGRAHHGSTSKKH